MAEGTVSLFRVLKEEAAGAAEQFRLIEERTAGINRNLFDAGNLVSSGGPGGGSSRTVGAGGPASRSSGGPSGGSGRLPAPEIGRQFDRLVRAIERGPTAAPPRDPLVADGLARMGSELGAIRRLLTGDGGLAFRAGVE